MIQTSVGSWKISTEMLTKANLQLTLSLGVYVCIYRERDAAQQRRMFEINLPFHCRCSSVFTCWLSCRSFSSVRVRIKSREERCCVTRALILGQSVPPSRLKCRVFDYQVGDYALRLRFLEENRIMWLYRAAPNGQTGKNATEQIERTQIRADVLLMRWKEADGTQVIDVLDLGRMKIYANFVLPNGDLGASEANLSAVRQDCAIA